jgi:ABC-type lipoprotein release transport system permease subunit
MLHIILTCAIILPLIISIFRDSKINGNQLHLEQQTHGQIYHVLNAKSEYLEYFKNIPGLSSYYENNTIFINITSEDEANNTVLKEEYEIALYNTVNELNDERLMLINMSEFGIDESIDKFPNQLLIVNAFIMIISLSIIQSAYKNHLNKFDPDIGVLVSYGAENRQIRKIFLFEFLITFIISAVSAVTISSVIMYLLFRNFLQVKDVGNLAWLIFRIDPLSLAVHLLVFGIVLLLVVMLCLYKKLRQTSIIMLHSDESGEKTKHYRKILEFRKNSVETLGRLISHRTNSRFISCLMISVPITIAVLFIFNYLIINIENVSQSPDYEITIQKDAIMSNGTGISDDDIAFVKGIDGLQIVKAEHNISPNKYLIKDDRMEGASMEEIGDDRFAGTNIYPYSDIENELKSKDFSSSRYNVAISKNHEYLKYNIGDKILLYVNEIGLTEENATHVEEDQSITDVQYDHETREMSIVTKSIELTVVQLLDYEWTDRMFSIYFTDEMYLELTKGESVLRLQLKLDNPGESKDIVSVLKNRFIGVEYSITNNWEVFEKNKESTIGVYIMALFIFSLMFAFILVILYVKLSDYVETQSKNIRLFYILGASKSDIYDSYMRLPLNISMISIVVSFIFGLGLCILFFQNTGYHLILNVTTIVVHLIIAMLILAAFNIPVHSTLKKKLKQF